MAVDSTSLYPAEAVCEKPNVDYLRALSAEGLSAGAARRITKAYGLLDLFATYDIDSRLKANFIVQNVFDKRYRPYLDAFASPGRVAKAALSLAFATR